MVLDGVLTHVDGVMSGLSESIRHEWRKGIVNEESQGTESRGSSRSRTASAA
jgi:hypothetical protein